MTDTNLIAYTTIVLVMEPTSALLERFRNSTPQWDCSLSVHY